MNRKAPLGVFDSGLGGLTVVRALRESLPHEDIVYLGDTARVPYGTKGADTVIRYALACAKHLQSRNVKAIVIACNTVSAVAPEHVRAALDLPVLSVIEPGARAAAAATRSGRVGVLATAGTIASGAYPRAIAALSTRIETTSAAAPLLVPLAEEGWLEGEVPRLAVRRYIAPMKVADIDALVLGCTHYPLLRTIIEEEVHALIGPHVRIIDTAKAAADDVRAFLESRNGLNEQTRPCTTQLLVTDRPQSFSDQARRFLGRDAESIEGVNL
jgi:glutamate racemase